MCIPVYGFYYAGACIWMVGLEGLMYFVEVFHIPCEYVLVTVCCPLHPRAGSYKLVSEPRFRLRIWYWLGGTFLFSLLHNNNTFIIFWLDFLFIWILVASVSQITWFREISCYWLSNSFSSNTWFSRILYPFLYPHSWYQSLSALFHTLTLDGTSTLPEEIIVEDRIIYPNLR